MAMQHHLKSLPSFHGFSSTSLKIKSLLKVYVRHLGHVIRVLTNAKSMVMEFLNKKNATYSSYNFKLRKKTKKLFSFLKQHLDWSSSHVTPMPQLPISDVSHANYMYYDSTWDSAITLAVEDSDTEAEPPLARYLDWLEMNSASGGDDEESEIDQLAEKFIASCHEKFRLEKQESYRRYQEMLARSL